MSERPQDVQAGAAPIDEWSDLKTAAAAVGVPRRTLNQAAREGKLPARRVADVWLVRLPDVRVWLRGARHRPGPRPGHGVGRPRAPKPPPDDEHRAA
jgi:hypothetical protein